MKHLILIIALCSSIQSAENRLSVNMKSSYGGIDGYLQTPAGGQPGSSTVGRPLLSELGIDHMISSDFELSAVAANNELYYGYQMMSKDSKAVIRNEFWSQNRFFHAGDVVRSKVQLDWMRAGYRRWFEFDRFSAAVGCEAISLDFDYQLNGSVSRIDRSYTKRGARLGVCCEYELFESLALSFSMYDSIVFNNTPRIFTFEMVSKYRATEHISFAVGVYYCNLDYEDKQELPNHINVEYGPAAIFGLSVNL